MSDPLRVGFVVEGPTDFAILEAIIGKLLDGREFEPVAIQPELSAAFAATTGGGWTAVYLWCRQMLEQTGGPARNNPLFDFHDLVVMQIDADVAGMRYTDDRRIQNPPSDLPFSCVCPPAGKTTNHLRKIMLGWLNEKTVPQRMVFCTPSKQLETWILVALFPDNRIAASVDVECKPNPDKQLQKQPLPSRLIRSGQKDIDKYRKHAAQVAEKWPYVRKRCTEADRFSFEFLAMAPPV